ncbi:MAG TPA: type IX secretion system sortase PorU [Bacteroidales bacterium]|nr:type IX secretion system sortase PorU [Bacteroidales bacterium]
MKRKSILSCLSVLLATLIALPAAAQGYTTSSLLSSGRWIKIAITEPGIYRIDYSQIRDMGFTDPSAVAIFGNNRGQLSFYNDGTAPDDLRQVAFLAEKGSDNIFNDGDFILFYGEGTHRYRYNKGTGYYDFIRHHYSDTAFYFITSRTGGALQVKTATSPAGEPGLFSTSTDVSCRYETEGNNLLRSGREWYQQVIPGKENTVDPIFRNLITSERIRYRFRALARSDNESLFTIKQGASVINTVPVPAVNMADINGVYASIIAVKDSCFPASSSPLFSVTFSGYGNLSATGYIDYLDLQGRAQLNYTDRQLPISDSHTAGEGNITQFSITGTTALMVWDVTDPFAPVVMESSFSGGNTIFRAETDSLCNFIAFSAPHVMRPVIKAGVIPNQNLHALAPAEMIIITHPLFAFYAQRVADMHLSDDGTTSMIVTPGQIYNEFSGGIPDAVAIRNFVRMMHEKGKNAPSPLKYLLLFGDGSYENKTPPPQNTSFIPTWQSVNSHIGVLSFTSDDFYGLLDDGEGEEEGFLDIAIGRLPVYDTTGAGIVTRKMSSYLSASAMGSWRNNLCMVADDEDGNLHMMDAESLSAEASASAPALSVEKIYLDAYRQETSVTGNSYPDVVMAINDRIAAGCLIFNYVGHGSETGLAHERVIRTDNINSWKNKGMLPLFITATCEFSRFDDVEINPATGEISSRTSAGEMVLLNPAGGGIALMSTTRVVYSAPNFTLNRNIYDYAFAIAADGKSMRMGDIIRLAKIKAGTGMNKRNFLLLGDPALRLAWPVNGKVVTDSINKISVELASDTLKALSVITVSGHIQDPSGNLMTSFNGTVEPVVYDKSYSISTLGNDGGSTMSFPVTGNIIFSGKTAVKDGLFRFSFIVPLDINYTYGQGRVTYYARNGDTDMNGSFTDLVVGGFSDIDINDTEGPAIRLFMNDTLFAAGGITDTSPSLLALISDESGINATGAGIGHNIIAWLDDDQSGAVSLNSLFSTDLGGHRSGRLTYQLLIPEKGEHTVSLRAWDNLNNPSVASLRFVVETSGMFRLTDLLCYPNPAVAEAWFTAGHNRPDSEIKITITVYNTSGRALKIIRETVSTAGYRLPDIMWDGCDDSGGRLARGLYIWQVEAVTTEGEKASASGRVIIL